MKYINIYNNLIKLTINKNLYKNFKNQDTFGDRMVFFLLHFAFFFKSFKNEENTKTLQDIYDYCFRQLELSIREIGYGDQSINKKMKDYINLFHSLLSKIHFWDNLSDKEKRDFISMFINKSENNDYLIDYFNEFSDKLKKKTLNSFIKSVSNV
jgi:cytochrome b pre-mRNA-processing protein 3